MSENYNPVYYPGKVGVYHTPDQRYTDLMFSHKPVTVIDITGAERICDAMYPYLNGSYSLMSSVGQVIVTEGSSFIDDQGRIHINYEFVK